MIEEVLYPLIKFYKLIYNLLNGKYYSKEIGEKKISNL
jgi:hypothetical protein